MIEPFFLGEHGLEFSGDNVLPTRVDNKTTIEPFFLGEHGLEFSGDNVLLTRVGQQDYN